MGGWVQTHGWVLRDLGTLQYPSFMVQACQGVPLPSHIHQRDHSRKHPPALLACLQNVPAEKLFSRQRAVQQLLAIVDGASMADSGRFFDWAGKEVEW